MKVKIPFLGFVEKTIQADVIQGFLRIFRETQDIHRVLAIIPLTLLVSHSWFMQAAPQISLVVSRINNDELFLLILCGTPALFMFCWAVFSSAFNPVLYGRQIIFIIWTGLAHRWFYDLETTGTFYLTLVSVVALLSYLPYAFWGLRPDQLFTRVQDEYKARKNAEPAVVTVPVPQKPEAENNAA